VRPRSSHASITTDSSTPMTSCTWEGTRKSANGATSTAIRNRRSPGRTTPPLRTIGESEEPRRSSPRTSGTRRSAFGARGISPSRSEPSTPANAQNRSPTITTPFGRAIPPRRGGRCRASARANSSRRAGRSTPLASSKEGRPATRRAAYSVSVWVLGCYQRPRPKKPSSASTRTTIRTIQRRDTSPLSSIARFGAVTSRTEKSRERMRV
jgi:hypothetical protein